MKTLTFLFFGLSVAAADIRDTRWQGGTGEWTDAAHWTQGVPDAWSRVSMNGVLTAELSTAQLMAVGGLRIGSSPGDRGRIVMADGAELVARRDFISAGGSSDSEADILIEDAALHGVSAFYLGGTGEQHLAASKAKLEIRGGSFLHRIITLGWGKGAEATLQITGSRAVAVHALDYLAMGVPGAGAVPSTSTLAFTLDEHGVTPVTIQSRRAGLSISRQSPNRCRLIVGLSAVPPRDDVTLIAAQVAASGTFDDLPEGAEIRASHAGRSYAWRLTYRGGKSGCDVVLTAVSGHADDAPVTKCRTRPVIPVPLWEKLPPEPNSLSQEVPAFAEAEGFGRHARGGRDGPLLWVENLRDDGPGSFRAAMMTRGPRRIAFNVSGEIALKSVLRVSEPFVTVDGTTAPSQGITFTGHGFMVTTHDVVLRHFRIRPGNDSDDEDALSFSDARRCIADHLSLSWGTDEVCSITGLSDEITVQWCIISEGLNRENHGYASLLGGERVSWHHNLMAHHVSRVPRFAGIVRADFRNNVLYNWGHTAGYGQFERLNYIANFLKSGPSTTQKPPLIHTGADVVGDGSLFLEGNTLTGSEAKTGFEPQALTTKPFAAPPVTTTSAAQAFEDVLSTAGVLPERRDATDTRIIRETRDGSGSIIKHSPRP